MRRLADQRGVHVDGEKAAPRLEEPIGVRGPRWVDEDRSSLDGQDLHALGGGASSGQVPRAQHEAEVRPIVGVSRHGIVDVIPEPGDPDAVDVGGRLDPPYVLARTGIRRARGLMNPVGRS